MRKSAQSCEFSGRDRFDTGITCLPASVDKTLGPIVDRFNCMIEHMIKYKKTVRNTFLL